MARPTKQEKRDAELRRITLLAIARHLELKRENDGDIRDVLMNVAGVLPRGLHEKLFAEKVYADVIQHLRELADDGGRS